MSLIEVEDFSVVKNAELDNANTPSKSKRTVETNLGMYIDIKGKIHTDKYCGYTWLIDENGKHIQVDENGEKEDVLLKIKPRFGLDLSVMIKTIFKDDEFYSYLGLGTNEPLIKFFYNEKLIENGEHDNSTGQLLAIVSFVELLERATRHSLIKKIKKVQENNIGKIRGRIVMNKHLSKNIFQAHQERIYCEHNVRISDIKENQILKYALKCAEDSLGKNGEAITRKINIVKNRFSEVSEILSCSVNEVDKVKNKLPNMFMNYIEIFDYAKIIIEGASVLSVDKGNNKVVPYAINSYMLFECYARACIKEELKKCNNVKMLKYVPDKNNIPDGDEYGAMDVINEDPKAYIAGKIIPDIVLEYTDDEDKKYYRVYDVKYKDATMPFNGRNDRLQLLAYNFMYNGDDNIGFIFPKKDDNCCSVAKEIDNNNDNKLFGIELFISANECKEPFDKKLICLYEEEEEVKRRDDFNTEMVWS